MKDKLIDRAVGLLQDLGFQVSDSRGTRSCFDIIAKERDNLFLIKVLINVEGLTHENAKELKNLANLISATPLVIGDHMKSTKLNEGVIYERHDVCVMGIVTLEYVLKNTSPAIYSIRGGYCVNVDSAHLVNIRKKNNLTQKELATELGISKQSIYRYEQFGRMSLEIAEKLIDMFKDDFIVPTKIFSSKEYYEEDIPQKHISELKKRVLSELQDIGFKTSLTNAPFDVIAKDKERVFTVVSNDWHRIERKINVSENISEIIGGYSVGISERKLESDVKVLTPDELMEIKSTKELIRLLREF